MTDMTPISQTRPLPDAIFAALDEMGAIYELDAAEVDTSPTALSALIADDLRDRGLQAEAGMSAGGMVLILHSTSERLNSGVTLCAFLTVTTQGAFWNVGVISGSYGDPGHFLSAAHISKRDDLVAMFRFAGGGTRA